MASEEMSSENLDNDHRRKTDTSLYYKLTYEPSAQVLNISSEFCQEREIIHN